MFTHLRSFIRYYTTSQHVEIASAYDEAQSLARVLALNGSDEVRVWKKFRFWKKPDRLAAIGAQWGPRANILPVFEGQFEQREGRVILTGRIEIDFGARVVIGMMGFIICVFFPVVVLFVPGEKVGNPVVLLWTALGFLCCAFLAFWGGKDDADRIVRNLRKALNESGCG